MCPSQPRVCVLRRRIEFTQYLSIHYTERLAEADVERSVGQRRRLVRQRARGDGHRPLQDRAHPPLWTPGATSTRSSTPPSSGWTGSITAGFSAPSVACPRRVRAGVSSFSRSPSRGGWTHVTKSPGIPGRFKPLSIFLQAAWQQRTRPLPWISSDPWVVQPHVVSPMRSTSLLLSR